MSTDFQGVVKIHPWWLELAYSVELIHFCAFALRDRRAGGPLPCTHVNQALGESVGPIESDTTDDILAWPSRRDVDVERPWIRPVSSSSANFGQLEYAKPILLILPV